MDWARLIVVCAVIVGAVILAKLVDMRMAKRELAPGAVTRYRVLRRSIMGVIIFLGVFAIVPILTVAERKLIGRFQNRYGPNRVGPVGLMQPGVVGL